MKPSITKVIKSETSRKSSKKSSESRPRFRRSKLSGRNLRRHPKGIKISWTSPALGRWDSGFEPQRIEDRSPRQVRLRACLKDLYGIRTTRITGKTIVRAAGKWQIKHGELDQRLDTLLHRSGLANSILQARQRISHSHIYVNNVRVKKPSHHVKVNELITIETSYWIQQQKSASIQWKNWNTQDGMKSSLLNSAEKVSNKDKGKIVRIIPSYLEVDYLSGSFVLVNKPTGQTTLLPAGLGKSAQVALWG